MASVAHPTVLLPVGPLGDRAVQRLRAAVDLDQPLVRVLDPSTPTGRADLDRALHELLRVGRDGAASVEPRLDLLALVDLTGPEPEGALLGVVRGVSELLAERYARVFPADAPPDQRTAALHVLAVIPPLAATPAAAAVIDALARLEAWLPSAPHPTLAKVWLAATQTAAGVLTLDDAAATAAGFALACLVGDVRRSEAMRHRLAHPRPGEGPLGFVSVATLDVPLGRVRTYARTRAAWDALDALVERVQRRATDPALALEQLGALADPALFAAFDDGDEARRLRDLAWRIAGGAEVPDRVAVGPFDTAERLRAAYPDLYRPTMRGDQGPSQVVQGALDAALGDLERAEGVAHDRVTGALRELLAGTLGGVHRLDRVPEVEAALGALARRLEDDRARDLRAAHGSEEPEDDAGLTALRAATDRLPEPRVLRTLGGAAGLALGLVAVAVGIAMGGAPAAPTGLSATVVTSTAPVQPPGLSWAPLVPWAVGAALGGLAGWALARAAGHRSRDRVRAALEDRRAAIADLRARGTGASTTRRAEERLRLHRLRARRDAISALRRAERRLQTVRAALVAARDTLADHLGALGVPPEPDAGRDDLSPLLEGGTRLHGHLVGVEALRRWLSRARRFADRPTWADRVLERTWPPDGLLADVPAVDLDAVLAAADEQVAHLDRRSLFDDPQAAAEAAAHAGAFAARATMALAPACVARDALGDVARGVRPGELLTVGPAEARAALEDALAGAEVHLGACLWAELGAPRLSFVRTWEGLHAAEIGRGAGLQGGR